MKFTRNTDSFMIRWIDIFASKLGLLFYSLVFCLACFAQDDDLYNPENSQTFATYLFKSGQYEMAAIEYERVLFFKPQDDDIKLRLFDSYARSGNELAAIDRADSFYESKSSFPEELAKKYTSIAFLNDYPQRLNDFLQVDSPLTTWDRQILLIHLQLMQSDWEVAALNLGKMNKNGKKNLSSIADLINEGETLPYKKPALAATLSAIIPGSGKFYTGDWKDALFGLVILGGNVYSSYRGFNKKGIESIQGWTFGIIGFGFYLANIYGAHKAAKRFNEKRQTQMKQKILKSFEANY